MKSSIRSLATDVSAPPPGIEMFGLQNVFPFGHAIARQLFARYRIALSILHDAIDHDRSAGHDGYIDVIVSGSRPGTGLASSPKCLVPLHKSRHILSKGESCAFFNTAFFWASDANGSWSTHSFKCQQF